MSGVLRDRAARHPDRTYLEVPWADESFSYGETLGLAEKVGAGISLIREDEAMAMQAKSEIVVWDRVCYPMTLRFGFLKARNREPLVVGSRFNIKGKHGNQVEPAAGEENRSDSALRTEEQC